MKRIIFYFLLTISMIEISSISGQTLKMDTLYYNSNWKGVHIKDLASYMRVVYYAPKGSNYNDVAKDFYITGELQGEGVPVYIDKYDDSKSKWKGQTIAYYKSGKKASESNYTDSSLPDKFQNS